VFFGDETRDKRSMFVTGDMVRYYNQLKGMAEHQVAEVGVHRLVTDKIFQNYKPSPNLIGDRDIIRFRIADSKLEAGGDASVGMDAETVGKLIELLKGRGHHESAEPFGELYLRLREHREKGFAWIPSDSAPPTT
jgi:hypothetical protein